MKRLLLLPLLLGFTSAVNAETWYLLGKSKSAPYTIPMESKEDCEEQGQRFIKFKNWKGAVAREHGYLCIKGK